MTAYVFSLLVPDNQKAPRFESNNAQPSMLELQYSLGGVALVNGDTITTPAKAFPVNGIRIQEVEVLSVPLDTNATPTGTFSIGDAGLASRFILNANMGAALTGVQVKNNINQAQALTSGVVTTGTNYLYGASNATYGVGTNGPVLVYTVSNAVATGATTGVIRLKVWYWCTGEN